MESPQFEDFESVQSDSQLALMESIENLQLPLEVKREINDYLSGIKESDDPKAEVHQQKVLGILNKLIESGEKEKAGLLFNLHRVLTEFRGYGANEKASSDVKACFNSDLEIPKKGLIVVDRFATRNLPAIVNWCEENGIDLGRIRIRVPRMLLAAQMNGMNDDKRQEYDDAINKLSTDCFLVKDVNHSMDIPIEEVVS